MLGRGFQYDQGQRRFITGFEKRVYEATRIIPKGQVKTYKDIAVLIGQPRAARAVGNALHKNRDPKVPCHRVIKSDRSLGGYRGGILQKIKLLLKEGVCVQGMQVSPGRVL